MDQFNKRISSAENQIQQAKMKNFTSGTDKKRWADVLTTFFQSEGVSSRRDAASGSNIDAVENVSSEPQKFLTLLQRVSPQSFTWGEQVTNEQVSDQFTDIVQEMIPVGDEERADIKRMLGRQIPEHEIEMLVNNSVQLIELIQQSFPEYNIQLEGVFDTIKNRVKSSAAGKAMKNLKSMGKSVVALTKGKRGAFGSNRYGLDKEDYDEIMQKGKAGLKSSVRGVKNFVKDLDNPATVKGKMLDKVLGTTSIPGWLSSSRGTTRPGDERDVTKIGDKTYSGLETHLRSLDLSDDDLNDLLSMVHQSQRGHDDVDVNALMSIQARLKQILPEMKTFDQIIKSTGVTLNEAPEDVEPPVEQPPEEMENPVPAMDGLEMEPDDVDKLQVDMLELVRRAFIINPKDIDSNSYIKLTTKVSFDNVRELKVLLNKLVQNHYPDLEMGSIEPGPGV